MTFIVYIYFEFDFYSFYFYVYLFKIIMSAFFYFELDLLNI